MVRDGDFRASGSGQLVYEKTEIPIECIEIAFDVAASLASQSCAFDFISKNGKWLIVEISYAFSSPAYYACPGYWDRSLVWRNADVKPEAFAIEDLMAGLKLQAIG